MVGHPNIKHRQTLATKMQQNASSKMQEKTSILVLNWKADVVKP